MKDQETTASQSSVRALAILISPLSLVVWGLLFLPDLVYQACRVNLWVAYRWTLPPSGDPVDLLVDD